MPNVSDICIYGFCIFIKIEGLHAWNSCSLVSPILAYCCLNKFCNSCQSTFIGSNDWYHNLASPKIVRQNLWTFAPSTKWCAFIQSFEQNSCASASSSSFPENSDLKYDQFKCTTCCCWPAWSCCCWAGGGLGAETPSSWSALSILH